MKIPTSSRCHSNTLRGRRCRNSISKVDHEKLHSTQATLALQLQLIFCRTHRSLVNSDPRKNPSIRAFLENIKNYNDFTQFGRALKRPRENSESDPVLTVKRQRHEVSDCPICCTEYKPDESYHTDCCQQSLHDHCYLKWALDEISTSCPFWY